MQLNEILKLLAGASLVVQTSAKHILETGHSLFEDHIIQGKYVSREEFDNLKNLVLELRQQLSDANKLKKPGLEDKE